MRHTPRYLMTDSEEVKRLIRSNPWATFVSATSSGLVASHYPVLLDETATDVTVPSHSGRPDDELHELGEPRRPTARPRTSPSRRLLVRA